MNFDNDSYQINITKNTNRPREDNYQRKNNNDSFFLPLFLAIVVGIWKSPDLIDIRDYIPRDTNQFPYKIEIKKNEDTVTF